MNRIRTRLLALTPIALLVLPATVPGQEAGLLEPVPPRHCQPDDPRIEVLLLGSYHMANPGADMFNVQADDVLAPERQREIAEVVDRLASFGPTRVAVEAAWGDTTVPSLYRGYRAGERDLSRNETQQLGFRLAERMGLETVHPIDVRGEFPFEAVRDLALADSTLTPYLEQVRTMGQAAIETIGRWLSEGTIGETLHRLNSPEAIHRSHAMYLEYFLPVVNADDDPGADLVAAWYERNIRIFANLHRMGLASEDRVLVVYGAGHVPILHQLVADSPRFCVEDPLDYLPEPGSTR